VAITITCCLFPTPCRGGFLNPALLIVDASFFCCGREVIRKNMIRTYFLALLFDRPDGHRRWRNDCLSTIYIYVHRYSSHCSTRCAAMQSRPRVLVTHLPKATWSDL
jgi:hypothetical protein